METSQIILCSVIFFGLLALGLPIAWAIGIASLAAILFLLDPLIAVTTLAQQYLTSLDSFTLLAIPFFILAGQIMNQGGIARRLIDLAKNLVGSLPGGLAHINIVSAMLFGSIAGSAVAAASAIGSVLGPKMQQEGYSKEFAAAVNITSATSGLIIPPSNVLIVYALASGGTSIATLFVAGYLPGILMGLILMFVATLYALHKRYPRSPRSSSRELLRSFLSALPSLTLLVVVIGGIVSGMFTATEASGIAVAYTLVLAAVYGELKLPELPKLILSAVRTTSVVLFLIMASISMSWVFSFAELPQAVSSSILGLSDNPIVILLLINLLLLIVGMFMDMTPAVLIFTPILLPIVTELGIDPVHFGIIMVMNLCIGICTPPVGTLLFVGVSVAGTTIERVIKPLMFCLIPMIAALLIVTFWPDLSLWLPRLFGLS